MEREVVERLVRVSKDLGEMLELTFQGFRKLSEASLGDIEEARKTIRESSTELTRFLVSGKTPGESEKLWAKPLLSMASSFDRMMYNMDGILYQLKLMIQESVSFSDRAAKEVNDIFQEAMDLLEHLPDLILTPDKHRAQQIGEKVRSLSKIVDRYTLDHEERLIQGICLPKSSLIYLGILESLKGVIVHTLEVSGKIIFLSSKS